MMLQRAPAVGTEAAVKSQDFGTSRWQLRIERYTNFPGNRKGRQCLSFVGQRFVAAQQRRAFRDSLRPTPDICVS